MEGDTNKSTSRISVPADASDEVLKSLVDKVKAAMPVIKHGSGEGDSPGQIIAK